MEKKKTNIVIVGAGAGCMALLTIFKKSRSINILGISDINSDAPGLKLGREMGIPVSGDYKEFLADKRLDSILNVTGSSDVQAKLIQEKPDRVDIISGNNAAILWELVKEQREISAQVKKQEGFLENIFDSISQPLYVIDVNSHEIVKMNSAAQELGVSSDKKTCYGILFDRENPCDETDKCPLEELKKTREPVSMEHTRFDKDGNIKAVQLTAYPIFNETGELVQMLEYAIDITEMKKAEADLRESKEEFRTMLNNVPGVIYRCKSDEKRTMLLMTEEIQKITGYMTSDFIGDFIRSYSSLIYSGDKAMVEEKIKQKTLQKEMFEVEYRVKSKDGKVRWVLDRGQAVFGEEEDPLWIDGAIFDITEQKLSTQAVEENEKKYRLLADNITDMIWTANMHFHFTYVSPSVERLLGYTPEEYTNLKLHELLPFLELKKTLAAFALEVKAELSKTSDPKRERILELKHKRKDGSLSWVEIKMTFLRNEKGKAIGVIGISRDIEERKQIELELKEREQELSQIISGSPIAIFTINKEHIVTHMNISCEKLLEISASKLLGKKNPGELFYQEKKDTLAEMVIDGQNFKEIKKLFNNVRKNESFIKGAYETEEYFPNLGKNGKWLFFTVAPIRNMKEEIIGAIETLQDVTGQKKASEKLEKAAQEWALTFDSIDDMISIHDTEFRILRANRAFKNAFNLTEVELKGKICYELVHGTTEPWPECPFVCAIETGESNVKEFFEPHLGMYLEVSVSPLFGPDGEIVGSVHIAKNISERKANEEALLESVKIKTDFTSMVSHELRTPLTAIKEGIGIVWDGSAGEINDDQKDFLGTAKRNVDRLGRLIDDVLDFTKLRSGKMHLDDSENDIGVILKEASKIQGPVVNEKGLDLLVEIQQDLPKIKADADKIAQVITNLINNAIKFTEKGSIKITAGLKNGHIKVAVIDSGPGIKEQNLPKIFQEFRQVEDVSTRKVGGTGLGLAISKEIVERHGGRLWVESEYGKGSSFIFTLPVTRKYKILVIDDDVEFVKLCDRLLTKSGYSYEKAQSGTKGLLKIKECQPDLIVLDMRLKDMNGYEVIGRMRTDKEIPFIPILAVSGHEEALDELDKLKLSGDKFIIPKMIKPFDTDEFLKNIKAMLA